MAAKILNIEVCDQIVKVCRTARKGKSVRVFDSFTFRTPDDCVSDGIIANPQVLGRELIKQLTEHGHQNVKNVVFALSSSKVAVREVKLPPMKGKLLAKAISTNAEDYFPVDLKYYHITHSLLDTVSGPNAFSRVLVMAAPISMLEGYFALAEKAGLTIKAIDSSGNSQYQALKSLNIKGVTIYVDVSSTSSLVSFIKDDQLLLQRTFAFGADELVSHYMTVCSKGNESYLDALHKTDITNPEYNADKVLTENEIQDDLSRLVSSIVRSVDYFNSSQWEASVSRVVLMGSNRHIVGLRELVAEATGIETLYLDSLPEFTAFTNGAVDASTYVSCIGSFIDPLRLIPPHLLPSGRHIVDNKDATILPGVVACLIFVVCGIAAAVFSITGYFNAVRELENTKDEISSLEYTEQVYESYISYQKGEEAVNSVSAEADTPNSKLVSFFEELEGKMPSSILILSAACTNDSISMNITVSNYTDAAAVISELRSFKSVALVEVSTFSLFENEAGVQRVSFTVNCVYGENPYINEVNPYKGIIEPSASQSETSATNDSQIQQSEGGGQ